MKKWLVFGLILLIIIVIFLIILNFDQTSNPQDNNESDFIRDAVIENDSNQNNTFPIDEPIEVDVSCRNEITECENLGGKWGCKGMVCVGEPCDFALYCNKPTSDAGKPCTDSSQCESYCQAPNGASTDSGDLIGKCYEYEFADCMAEVRNGTFGGTWCI